MTEQLAAVQAIPTPAPERRTARVALVNMPFSSTRYPSIQLGLLQAIVKQRGHHAQTFHFNLRFAKHIGWDTYERLSHARTNMLGEWLFSRAAFGESTPDSDPYVQRFGDDITTLFADGDWTTETVRRVRDEDAPAFIRDCYASVDWEQFDVVGFGSVFEQNCAALALARLIKERYPRIVTVFGGANFEDEMGLEYLRTVPWVDFAVVGEGDEAFPNLLDRLAQGEEILNLPGVAHRDPSGAVLFPGRAPSVADLDALPEPEYEDFFSEALRVDLPGAVRGQVVMLPFETARGCWWGQKHHCTFCGLNGAGLAYRSKSPERALAGIEHLAERYHVYAFEAVDNILDHRYIRDVFGPITERRRDYTFFYEVKANLTPEQIKDLAKGGIRRLQPGIESLSTPVLKLMRKGTTGIQNVRFLKWARYYGVHSSWNILTGFPGERAEDYAGQLATMRLIPHLQPPGGAGRIWLERFSPNYTEAAELGFRDIHAEEAYRLVYPAYMDHDKIAYFFSYNAADTLPQETHAETLAYIKEWQAAWNRSRPPYLLYQRGAGRITVFDGRANADAPALHTFDERAARIYEFCGLTYHGVPQIVAHLRETYDPAVDEEAVRADLDRFLALGLTLEEGGHYLSLALPANVNW